MPNIPGQATVQCTVYSVQCTVYSVQCTVYNVQCTVYSVQCTVYSVQCTVSAVTGPLLEWHNNSTQLNSTSIPSVRLILPADPSGVPGLGLDTVFLDLHTPDLAQHFLPVPGTLEAVVARQELPLLLDVAELPGVEDNLVVLRLAVAQDGGVIETVGRRREVQRTDSVRQKIVDKPVDKPAEKSAVEVVCSSLTHWSQAMS